jgi:hypothetical protein
MINNEMKEEIERIVIDFAKELVTSQRFLDIAKGKEIGHRIADFVDGEVDSKLFTSFPLDTVKHEVDRNNEKIPRSMGDLWFKSNEIFNPINIKTGIVEKGQPNICSLVRVFEKLVSHQIDSYYLLIIKFQPTGNGFIPKVYFFDILDYLDYVQYDSGTGQMMLKEDKFYKEFISYKIPKLTLKEKVDKCFNIINNATDILILHRRQRNEELEIKCNDFAELKIIQKGLHFG